MGLIKVSKVIWPEEGTEKKDTFVTRRSSILAILIYLRFQCQIFQHKPQMSQEPFLPLHNQPAHFYSRLLRVALCTGIPDGRK